MGWAQSLALGLSLTSAALASGGEAFAQTTTAPGELQMVTETSASGIEGRVIIRPVRPVERRGVTNQRPYQARIIVIDAAGREVAAAESDAEGRFRVPLPPGSYVLRPQSPGPYPRASEQRVVVQPQGMTQVDVVYDSGMR